MELGRPSSFLAPVTLWQLETPFHFDYGPGLLPGPNEPADGIWRWRKLLPPDGSGDYPLQIGGTPLVRSERLRAATGLPGLVLKDETRTPTGSNKDRATALCCVDGLRRSASGIAAASSGNVAVSLSAGAAAVGLQAYVFVSGRTVAPQKVGLMRSFGATVLLVDGSYEQAYRLSEEACQAFGWYSRNTGENLLAVQGKKTVAFEVWEQLGGQLPALAYLPVGDGVTLAAFAHGCAELIRCGAAERLPVIVGVQAAGAAPLARAYAAGQVDWQPGPAETVADGIAVGDPFFGRQALEAVRASGGDFVTVSDEQLAAAIALLATNAGMLAEPAGVASLAGALADRERAARADGSALALISGTGLKDHRWLPTGGGRAIEVAPELSALSRQL
jgi:threonine synthase